MARRRIYRHNPDDEEKARAEALRELFQLGEEQEVLEQQLEQEIRQSFTGGLTAAAYDLILDSLADLNVARMTYRGILKDLQDPKVYFSRQERRDRVAARRALEDIYGANALRAGMQIPADKHDEPDIPAPSTQDRMAPVGVPVLSARRYYLGSRPARRYGVLRELELEEEHGGIGGSLAADRHFATALIARKRELERRIAASRTESTELRSEWEQKLKDLKAIAEEFIETRKQAWEEAGNLGASFGIQQKPKGVVGKTAGRMGAGYTPGLNFKMIEHGIEKGSRFNLIGLTAKSEDKGKTVIVTKTDGNFVFYRLAGDSQEKRAHIDRFLRMIGKSDS
jgi:hypothetical protein